MSIERWISRSRLCRAGYALLALMASQAFGQPVPIHPAHPGAWLVFLCQPSDDASTPKDVSYFEALFDRNNPDLLQAYFQKVSHGKVDVSSPTILGWFRMDVTRAEIDPSIRNNSTSPNRSQTVADCAKAGVATMKARGFLIDPAMFAGFIVVLNIPVDVGHAGGRNIVANHYEPAAFYQHEMLHAMGQLNHTRNLANDSTANHEWGSPSFVEYDDPWDIMSYNVGIFAYDSRTHGSTGPELNMAYRSEMGWLPTGRSFTKVVRKPSDRTPVKLTLAPVSEPTLPGPLMAVVDLPGGVRYAVEYRKANGFDRGVPRGEVVVREWRADRMTYLVRQPNGHIGYFPGEPPFTDPGNRLRITVNSIGPAGADIHIDPNYPLNPDRAFVRFLRFPTPMTTGDSKVARVEVTNTGPTSWTPQSHLLRLSAMGSAGVSGPSVPLPGRIDPGQTRTFSFDVRCDFSGRGTVEVVVAGASDVPVPAGSIRTLFCRR